MNVAQLHHDLVSVILSKLASEYKERKAISTRTLTELDKFFHAPLRPALGLIDKRRVKRMKSRSGRVAFQVAGEAKNFYTCLPKSNFCSCYSYLHQVLRKQEIPMCKHILAARIADELGTCEEVDCLDKTMTFVLKSLA